MSAELHLLAGGIVDGPAGARRRGGLAALPAVSGPAAIVAGLGVGRRPTSGEGVLGVVGAVLLFVWSRRRRAGGADARTEPRPPSPEPRASATGPRDAGLGPRGERRGGGGGPRITPRAGPTRCPFCRDEADPADSVACTACLSRHHRACWDEHGRCANCQGIERFAGVERTEPPPEPDRGSREADRRRADRPAGD